MLLLGNNAASTGLHEVLLVETTGSVLGGAVEDLGLGANGLLELSTTAHERTSLATIFTGNSHCEVFLLLNAIKKSAAPSDSTYLNAAHDLRPSHPSTPP